MNLKLKYDPKRTIRLRKNEILDELRIKFSQKVYEVFKSAEEKIWSDSDQNCQFIEEVVIQLQSELELLSSDLTERAQAWTNVEKAETTGSRKITVKPVASSIQTTKRPINKARENQTVKVSPAKNQASPKSASFLPEPDFDIPPQKLAGSPKTPLQPFEEDEFDFFEEL